MKMNHNLHVLHWFYYLCFFCVLILFLVCCQDCNPFHPSDLPPEATLTLDKTSVNKGDSVNAKVGGIAKSLKDLIKDANSKTTKFIVSYHLDIDYNEDGIIDKMIDQETPIDTNERLDSAGKTQFSAMVIDSAGLTSKIKSLEVIVNDIPGNHVPLAKLNANPLSLKQGESSQISLTGTDEDNDAIIKYKIWGDFNLDGTVNNDEIIEQTSPISSSKQFNNPGTVEVHGEVTDEHGAVGTSSANISVNPSGTNKLPQVDLTGVDANVLDGKQKIIILPQPTDEDTPGVIPYTNAEIIDGSNYIENISINSGTRELEIKAKPVSQNQNYKIKLSFGTDGTNKNTANLEGVIENLCNVQGRIESNGDSAGVGKSGDVIGYIPTFNEYGQFIGVDEKIIDETHTSNGSFNVQASKPATDLLVRARFDESGNLDGDNKSYVRSIILDATKDYSNIVLTCEPSPNPVTLPVTKQQFADWIGGMDELMNWDLTTIEGIEILYKHPEPSKGEFTTTMQDAIAERVKASNGAEAFFDNKISLDSKIQVDNESTTNFHYYYNIAGFSAYPNWIVIVPVYNLTDISGYPCQGLTGVQYLNNNSNLGIINGSVIRLNATTMRTDVPLLKRVSMHELNHAILSPSGEGNSIVNPYSVMGNKIDAGSADLKKAHIVYNGRYDRMEEYRKILGLEF